VKFSDKCFEGGGESEGIIISKALSLIINNVLLQM
jgi:hypothetical protein